MLVACVIVSYLAVGVLVSTVVAAIAGTRPPGDPLGAEAVVVIAVPLWPVVLCSALFMALMWPLIEASSHLGAGLREWATRKPPADHVDEFG